MIIYGVGKKHLLTESLDGKCPKCNSDDSISMEVSAKYFHIFWIPFATYGKKVFVICLKCRFNWDLDFLPQQFKEQYAQIKSSIHTPRYLFTGLVLTLLIIVFFIFRGIEKDKRTEEYIYTPKAGDIYEIKTEDNWYTLLTIVNVIDDSVFVCYHKYEIDRKYDLKDLNREKDFDAEIYFYFKDELINLYNEGNVLSVERGPAIIPDDQYQYDFKKGEAERVEDESYIQIDSIKSRPAKPAAK